MYNISVCLEYLGMENGDIPDENIQALAIYSSSYPAHNGRLNSASSVYWAARGSTQEPWIQADIGYQTYVSGVATQGVPDGCWTTSIKVSTFYMTTNDNEMYVSEDGNGGMAKVTKPFFLAIFSKSVILWQVLMPKRIL